MKISFWLSIISCLLATLAAAQQSNERCPFLKMPEFNVFIPGYSDTVQANGLKARTIDARALVNGFELIASDSNVHVTGFHLVFDDDEGNLYSKTSKGNKVLQEKDEVFSMKRISLARLVTIDNITVEYKGNCYVIPGQLYYAK